jgi:SAM-dependent methyltransferase
MKSAQYLMESSDEALRLDLKTDGETVAKQAAWAGIRPGMRVADLGCGAGKTTSILHQMVQPGGEVVGVDISENRIEHAVKEYGREGITFECRDILSPLEDLGSFDFIWVRFVLEYYLADSFNIVKNINKILRPGGILCLIDLDHNCLSHFGLSDKLATTLQAIMKSLQEKAGFDPYVGRRIYSFLYDLGFQDIEMDVRGHHVIYGQLKDSDAFNWLKKVEVAPQKIGYPFLEYDGGYEEFLAEFKQFFSDPRRFTYSPIMSGRGVKPSESS